MTDYTRLTVAGALRRVDVVVPSDEPVGAVLPGLIRLLDEPQGTVARPLTLVMPDGEPLDIARSPHEQELLDGTALRLIRLDAAPPPPLVIDVVDAAADAHGRRSDRWDSRSRRAVAFSAIGALTAAAGLAVPLAAPGALLTLHSTALAVLVAAAIGFGLARSPHMAAAFAAASAGLAVPVGVDAFGLAMTAGLVPVAALIAVAAALLAAGIVVALAVGVALRRRGALAGGVIGIVLNVLLVVPLSFGMPAAEAATIAAVVAALVTGLLPWIALSAAGLTALDHGIAEGEPVTRGRAAASIDDAYAALTWGVAATATSIAVNGATLVAARSLWPGLLALSLALVAALRTRAFPSRVQVALLWSAVAVIAAAAVPALLVTPSAAWIVVAGCAVVAIVVAAAALATPRPHQRARLRSLGNTLEMLAVVSLIPLALGVFGVYADLLSLFGGGA